MIQKIIAQMSTVGKKAWAAFKAAIKAGSAPRTAPISYLVVVSRIVIPLSVWKVGNAGKLVRTSADHAPVFSLYTFFGLPG